MVSWHSTSFSGGIKGYLKQQATGQLKGGTLAGGEEGKVGAAGIVKAGNPLIQRKVTEAFSPHDALCSRLLRNLKISSDCPKHEATLIFRNNRALQTGHPIARAVTFKSPYRAISEILASKTTAGPKPVTSATSHATQFLLFKPKALSSA